MNDNIRDRSPLRRENRQAIRMAVPQVQKHHIDCVPEYDGNPSTLAIFIQSSEYLINNFSDPNNAANPQNEFLLRAVIGKLTGRALNLVGSRGNLRNWLSIKNLLLQFFSDQRDENCLVGDLMHLKQGKFENPVNFGYRCQDLLSLLLNKIQLTEVDPNIRDLKKNLYENQARNAFLRGLHSNLPIRLRNPQNLEQAISFTIEEQNFMYARRNLTLQHSIKPPSPHFKTSPPWRQNVQRPLYQNLSPVNQIPFTQTRQNLIQPNHNSPRSAQIRNPSQIRPQPVPMDTSSANTRRTERPQSRMNQSNRIPNQRNFISEELFQQEIQEETEEYNSDDYNYDDYYTADHSQTDQYEFTEYENDQYSDLANENFQFPQIHQQQT